MSPSLRPTGPIGHAGRIGRTLVAAGLLLAAGASQAGPLRASASLATDPANAVTAESPAVQAQASYPNALSPAAQGTAQRRHLLIEAAGGGAGDAYNAQYAATTDVSTAYELWNLRENRPLTPEEAAPLTLDFNFNLSGGSSVQGFEHVRSVGLSGMITGGNWARSFGSNAGYIGGFPADVLTGDQSLLAPAVDLDWSLLHTNATGGTLSMQLQGAAAITGALWLDLWLESVTLVEQALQQTGLLALGPASAANLSWQRADGLGVALRDGDAIEMIVVVPADAGPGSVPTPTTLALLLPALACLGLARRRPSATAGPALAS